MNKTLKKIIILFSMTFLIVYLSGCAANNVSYEDILKNMVKEAMRLDSNGGRAENQNIIDQKYNNYRKLFNDNSDKISNMSAYTESLKTSQQLLYNAFVKSGNETEIDASISNNLVWVLSPESIMSIYNNLKIAAAIGYYLNDTENIVNQGSNETSGDRSSTTKTYYTSVGGRNSYSNFQYSEMINGADKNKYRDMDTNAEKLADLLINDRGANNKVCGIKVGDDIKAIMVLQTDFIGDPYTVNDNAEVLISSKANISGNECVLKESSDGTGLITMERLSDSETDEKIKDLDTRDSTRLQNIENVFSAYTSAADKLGRFCILQYKKTVTTSYYKTGEAPNEKWHTTKTITYTGEGKVTPKMHYNYKELFVGSAEGQIKEVNDTAGASKRVTYNEIINEVENKSSLILNDKTRSSIFGQGTSDIVGFATATSQYEDTGTHNTNTKIPIYDFTYFRNGKISLTELQKKIADYDVAVSAGDSNLRNKIGDAIYNSGYFSLSSSGKFVETGDLMVSSTGNNQKDLLTVKSILLGLSGAKSNDYNKSGNIGNDFIIMYANVPIAGLRLLEPRTDLTAHLHQATDLQDEKGYKTIVTQSYNTINLNTFIILRYVKSISSTGELEVEDSNTVYSFEKNLFYKINEPTTKINAAGIEEKVYDFKTFQDKIESDEDRKKVSEWYSLDSSFTQSKPGTMLCTQYETIYDGGEASDEPMPLGRKLFLNRDIIDYDVNTDKHKFTSTDVAFAYLANAADNTFIDKTGGSALKLGAIKDINGATLEGFSIEDSDDTSSSQYPDPINTAN